VTQIAEAIHAVPEPYPGPCSGRRRVTASRVIALAAGVDGRLPSNEIAPIRKVASLIRAGSR